MDFRYGRASLNGLVDSIFNFISVDILDVTGSLLIDGHPINTDDVVEGVSNLYYTDARVDAYVTGTLLSNWTADNTFSALTIGNLTVTDDAIIGGNLTVQGTVTALDSENVLIEDPHIYLNSNYYSPIPRSGGLVVNYRPSSSLTSVGTGGFVAGVDGVSNPTVQFAGLLTGVNVGDLISISGANNPANNGLFEVLSVSSPTITIRGIGTTACVETFTQNQFVTDSTAAGVIVKTSVSVMQVNTSGLWETARGSSTGFAFNTLPTITGTGVDNYIVRFDGASGLQSSGCLILDTGEMQIADRLDTISATAMYIGDSNCSDLYISHDGITSYMYGDVVISPNDGYNVVIGAGLGSAATNVTIGANGTGSTTTIMANSGGLSMEARAGAIIMGSDASTTSILIGNVNNGLTLRGDLVTIEELVHAQQLGVNQNPDADCSLAVTSFDSGADAQIRFRLSSGSSVYGSLWAGTTGVVLGGYNTTTGVFIQNGGVNVAQFYTNITMYNPMIVTSITGTGNWSTSGTLSLTNASPVARYDFDIDGATGDFYLLDQTNTRYMLQYDVSANEMDVGADMASVVCTANQFKATGSGGTSWLINDTVQLEATGFASTLSITSASDVVVAAGGTINLNSDVAIDGDLSMTGSYQGTLTVNGDITVNDQITLSPSTNYQVAGDFRGFWGDREVDGGTVMGVFMGTRTAGFTPPIVGAATVASGELALDATGGGSKITLNAGDIRLRNLAGTTNYVYINGSTVELGTLPLQFTTTGISVGAPVAAGTTDRIRLYAVGGDTNFAMGIESGTMWYSVPSTSYHRKYVGTTRYMSIGGGITELDTGPLVFDNSGVTTGAPATNGSTDRLRIYDAGGSLHNYAMGISSSTLWYCVPESAYHRFYDGTNLIADLRYDHTELYGDIKMGSGNDTLTLGEGDIGPTGAFNSVVIGSTAVNSATSIYSGSANITLQSESGLISMETPVVHKDPYAWADVGFDGTSQTMTTTFAAYAQTATLRSGANFTVNTTGGGTGSIEYDGTPTLRFLVIVSISNYSTSGGVGWTFEAMMYKNGVAISGGGLHRYFSGTNDRGHTGWNGVVQLATGDDLRLWVRQTASPPISPVVYMEHMQITVTALN